MGNAERFKLSAAQKAAIDEYNSDLPAGAAKVNKHYSAERAQWLNDNVFAPAAIELVPVPSAKKLKKAQFDARRNSSQPTASSLSHSMSGRKPSSAPDEDINFNVSMSYDSFADPIKEAITDQLQVLRSEFFTKADGKRLLRDMDSRLLKFEENITKSIASMLGKEVIIVDPRPKHNPTPPSAAAAATATTPKNTPKASSRGTTSKDTSKDTTTKKRQNPYVDDEAAEVHLPLQQEAKKRRGVNRQALEDSSEEDPEAQEDTEAEAPKEDPPNEEPKTWTVKDETGKEHTVSIKEIKGKWVWMSSGVRIEMEPGKSAEETVNNCILFGDETDLIR